MMQNKLHVFVARFTIPLNDSLRKQPTFGDATTGFTAKWRLRNERRNSMLMTRHYPDLGSSSDWSCRVGNLFQPFRSTTQIWVVTRHQYRNFCARLAGKPVVASPNVGRFSGYYMIALCNVAYNSRLWWRVLCWIFEFVDVVTCFVSFC